METVFKNRGRKLIQGSFLNTIQLVVTIVIAFFMFPFLVHNLGNKTYGIWVLIMTFMDYYILLRLGFSTAIVRYLSRAVGAQDKNEMTIISSTSFIIYLVISIAMIFITFGLIFGAKLFVDNPINLKLVRTIILILGLNTAISPPLSVFGAILDTHMKYFVSKSANILVVILKNGLIFFLVHNGKGLVSMALVYLICNILVSTFLLIYTKFKFPYIKIGLRYFDRKRLKSLLSFSVFAFIAQFANKLRFKVDAIVISVFIGLAAVTHYNVGYRLIMYFIMFITAISGSFQTYISQEEGAGNLDSIRNKFIFTTKLFSFISVFIGFSLIFYGKPFIHRWMGFEYNDSYRVLVVLSVSSIIFLSQIPSKIILYGFSKIKFWAISNMIEGIFNVILSLILVTKIGLLGVALGTAIPLIFIKLVIQPKYVTKILQIELKEYYKILFINILKPSLILLLFYFIVNWFLRPQYLIIFTMGLIQTIVFVIICYNFFFNNKERRLIRAAIK